MINEYQTSFEIHTKKTLTYQNQVTDPHSVIQESTGAVASDSLAAESQAFQSANKNAEPLGVSGSNSNFANTDTSAATEIPAARDAPSRLTSTERKGIYPDNAGGQDKAAAVESTYKNTSTQGGPGNKTEAAPTYVNNVSSTGNLHDGQKPKGKNLHEVGDSAEFDRAKNASFTADIGSKDDPSRLAENKFAAKGAESVTASGLPNMEGKRGGELGFDVLKSEEPNA